MGNPSLDAAHSAGTWSGRERFDSAIVNTKMTPMRPSSGAPFGPVPAIGRTRECFGGDVVCRHLDGLGEPAVEVEVEVYRDGGTAGQRIECGPQAALGQDRRGPQYQCGQMAHARVVTAIARFSCQARSWPGAAAVHSAAAGLELR